MHHGSTSLRRKHGTLLCKRRFDRNGVRNELSTKVLLHPTCGVPDLHSADPGGDLHLSDDSHGVSGLGGGRRIERPLAEATHSRGLRAAPGLGEEKESAVDAVVWAEIGSRGGWRRRSGRKGGGRGRRALRFGGLDAHIVQSVQLEGTGSVGFPGVSAVLHCVRLEGTGSVAFPGSARCDDADAAREGMSATCVFKRRRCVKCVVRVAAEGRGCCSLHSCARRRRICPPFETFAKPEITPSEREHREIEHGIGC